MLASLAQYAKESLDETSRVIKPGDLAPVILFKDHFYIESKKWGLPSSNGVHINARSESVLNKMTFKDHIRQRRCIIPARRFYEYDPHHNQVGFQYHNKHLIYMAGFYDEEDHFIVMTTAANESVAPFHDRMPLVLEAKDLRFYFDDDYYESLLKKKQPKFDNDATYQQLSLFDE
jgi:putative SOS response-associated peptidase YedK